MTTVQNFTILFIFSLISCANPEKAANTETNNSANKTEIKDSPVKQLLKDTVLFPDIKRFIVDGYPVTYAMMAEQKVDNSSSYTKTSGKTRSSDKAWFSNETIKQTLVFELYTDGHRLVTYHFYNYDIPPEVISRIELHTIDGELAGTNQKLQDFKGFLNQAVKISSTYFITDKDFKLGDSKQKVLKYYGQPDKSTKNNKIEILEWDFVGDMLYDGNVDLKGKPLVENSYGHQAYLFFKNEKLIGQILHNDIP